MPAMSSTRVDLAIGEPYDSTECVRTVGEDREGNDSAAHVDMIVDMTTDSRIELDGEIVQRDGTFAFEEEFEA